MKIAAIPKSGRVGWVIYSKTRYGFVARSYTPPANPRTPAQQAHRGNVRSVSGGWRKLDLEKKAAWGRAAVDRDSASETHSRVGRSGYHLFVSLNTRRADLGLPQFDFPPDQPLFTPSPVAELALTHTGNTMTIKLRVSGTPARYTLLQAPAPTSAGVRHVPHFPFLCLLPPPIDGWSDITALYVARYGLPKLHQAVWIRICQHIDGWTDVPTVIRTRVPASPAGAQ